MLIILYFSYSYFLAFGHQEKALTIIKINNSQTNKLRASCNKTACSTHTCTSCFSGSPDVTALWIAVWKQFYIPPDVL